MRAIAQTEVRKESIGTTPRQLSATRVADRLLNKWAVEQRTSLDITTIYRKMKAGTFPQPLRVGRRRVAWRESDIAAWQAGLEVGTHL
jgi:prophage regulatory protein